MRYLLILPMALLLPLVACAPARPVAGVGSGFQNARPAAGCDQLLQEAPHSTFVMYVPARGEWRACNPARAQTPFLPASTYKVPHALIALETGVVTDPAAAFAWDGAARRVAAWNRPTSLADGLRNSTVWVYQSVARQVGWAAEQRWVERLDYGNRTVGPAQDLTSFWLDGALRITAVQQVDFLDRLRRGVLDASPATQSAVQRMMAVDDGPDAAGDRMFAKSGAVLPIDPETGDISDEPAVTARLAGDGRVGWYVGWIDAPGEAADVVFALNLRLDRPGDLGRRAPLARALLAANRPGAPHP